MATTWADLDAELVLMLGLAAQATPEQRMSHFNRALLHFAEHHTAKCCMTSFSGDGSTQEFAMPADYVDWYAVYLEDMEMFLEPKDFLPGVAWDQVASPSGSLKPYGFLEWPHGTLSLFYPPEQGTDNLKVWYFGYWPEITDDADVVEAPAWAHEALLCYAAALAHIPQITSATSLNEYRQRPDAGTPMDNPFIQAHDVLMARYDRLLADRPRQMRRNHNFRAGGRG